MSGRGIFDPPNTGDKLDGRWIGPAKILRRTGVRSYDIQVKPDYIMSAPLVFLKPFITDTYSGVPTHLFYHTRTPISVPIQEDENVVKKIHKHKREPDGTYKFLTSWEDSKDITWQDVATFIPKYNTDLIAYCKRNNLVLDLAQHLRDTPME